MTSDVWLTTVRIARDVGTLDDLLPPGVPTLHDCPWTVFSAIQQGLMFLAWDELPEDERPPRWIWQDGDRLNDWFDAVKRRREAQYGGSGAKTWDQSIEDPVENEAAKGLIVG